MCTLGNVNLTVTAACLAASQASSCFDAVMVGLSGSACVSQLTAKLVKLGSSLCYVAMFNSHAKKRNEKHVLRHQVTYQGKLK